MMMVNRGTLISAGVAIGIAIPTIWYMAQTHQIDVQQLQLEKERAERERAEAQSKVDSYRKQLEAAQTKFTNTLGTLIEDASTEANRTEGRSQLVPAAKALVRARNGFRSSLESVSQRLNSELDQLGYELSRDTPDLATVTELVEVLKRSWPAKKHEIDLAVRKIITELGLVPEG